MDLALALLLFASVIVMSKVANKPVKLPPVPSNGTRKKKKKKKYQDNNYIV